MPRDSVLVMFTKCASVAVLLAPLNSFAIDAGAGNGGGGKWTRVGPHNIFNAYNENGTGPLPMGEGGTFACAHSIKTNPNVIYAGGQNNGVSSGILKTMDGGKTWSRKSSGMYNTAVLGVWVHPDDPTANHVFAGTHAGIYETTDGAENWHLVQETASWGGVMSFREGIIQGKQFILANNDAGAILTLPRDGDGTSWQRIKAPGVIAPNGHLSVVINPDQTTEVLTCIGGWGGGQLYYATLDTPTHATWTGPLMSSNETYPTWDFFPGTSQIWGLCSSPTACNPGIESIGQFTDLQSCQVAVNATSKFPFPVAGYTYQHNVSSLGDYAAHCYVMTTFEWTPGHPQADVDSGRAPGTFGGNAYDCANAAVDPNDRNHFLFSKGGEYRAWESKDGGKTVTEFVNHDTGVYFVMIDQQSWLYTATQAGAFVSMNGGENWSAYHVFMVSPDGKITDRVPHDYQRIVPDFRGDQIALPSDQGLHIVNGTNLNLTSAVGDLKNNMVLSALISPSNDGSRNIVCNIWDWDVVASWNDGETWTGWNATEHSPGQCGEGGGGSAMGRSGKAIMFHHNNWWFTEDGGHNFKMGNLPGSAGNFDYVRTQNSRTEPAGPVFAILDAPSTNNRLNLMWNHHEFVGYGDDDDDDDDHVHPDGTGYYPGDDDEGEPKPKNPAEEIKDEMDPWLQRYVYYPGLLPESTTGNIKYLMVSKDFGNNWTWIPFPENVQAGGLAVDPTTGTLYAYTANCLMVTKTQGNEWSDCLNGTGLNGTFSSLIIKNSSTMFMFRSGAVPLRTIDGGATWTELISTKQLFQYGATFSGSLSWTGETLVLSGNDPSAVSRQEYGTYVWKSIDDGDSWTDETGDLVTISPGPGVWFEKDFYFVTRGEGLTVKRDFEA